MVLYTTSETEKTVLSEMDFDNTKPVLGRLFRRCQSAEKLLTAVGERANNRLGM